VLTDITSAADQLLPPGREILVKVNASQLPESVTAESKLA